MSKVVNKVVSKVMRKPESLITYFQLRYQLFDQLYT